MKQGQKDFQMLWDLLYDLSLECVLGVYDG